MFKRIFSILCLISLLFVLISCGDEPGVDPTPVVDEYATHKLVLQVVSSYDLQNTEGFEYAMTQKLDASTVLQSHSIVVSIKKSGNATKEETTRTLNTEFDGTQYIETKNTTSFTKGEDFKAFAGIDLSRFNLSIDAIQNIELTEIDGTLQLAFGLVDAKAFLETDSDVENLQVVLTIEEETQALHSVSMSYDLPSSTIEYFLEVFQ